MRSVPVLRSSDIRRSVAFYTEVLDFEPRWPQHLEPSLQNGVVDLVRDEAIVQLSIYTVAKMAVSAVNLELDSPAEVDALWLKYTVRGLDQSHRIESPVHLAPLNQTWGTREVYINDPDGNCLCLRAWLD